MKKHLIYAALAVAIPMTAQATPFSAGDVFAALSGQVNHYSSAGVLLDTYTTGGGSYNTGMAFDTTGNLFVTNFGVNRIGKISGPNDPHTTTNFANQSGNPEMVVFNLAGDAYVSSASTGYIGKYNSAGTLLGSIDAGSRADFIDLTADQNTLYYTTEGNFIGRIDVNTGVVLSNFASGISGTAYALRILSDGGVLLADNGDVKRFNSSGVQIQSYDIAGVNNFFALNLNPDGTSFWSGSYGNGNLYEFDLATGANTQTISTGSGTLYGVAVFGEATQGGGCRVNCGGNHVPEPASLALLGIGVAGLAAARRRKQTS